MKQRLLTLIVFVLVLSLALPALAADSTFSRSSELPGDAKKVWFWGGQEFAVVSNGDVDQIYIRDGAGHWSTELVLGGAQVFNIPLKVLSVTTTPERMYMVTEKDNEIEIYASKNGVDWDNVVMMLPQKTDDVWLTSVGPYDMVINTDVGIMVRYQDYNATWNLQASSSCATWDNVTAAGGSTFAVIDGELQKSQNLRQWQPTGYKISSAVVDAYNYREIGGKAVPSVDYDQDQTLVAYNPAQMGSLAISTDAGASWLQPDSKQIMGTRGWRITAVAVSKDIIFAGTHDNGILYSTDSGQTWQIAEINGKVTDLAYKDRTLLAATSTGVHRWQWQPGAASKPKEESPADPGEPEQPKDDQDQSDDSPIASPGSHIKFVLGQKNYQVGDVTYTMDVPTMSQDGRIFLPVRYLALAMGVPEEGIQWSGSVVTLNKDNVTVELQMGSDIIKVNSALIIANKPLLVSGRTLLPARWIAQGFGYTVDWDAAEKTMHILPQ